MMTIPDTNKIEYKYFDLHQFSNDKIEQIKTALSNEYLIRISINGNPFVAIACSGSNLDLLVMGHLQSEGIIRSYDEIKEIKIDKAKSEIDVITEINDDILTRLMRLKTIPSSCGQGKSETQYLTQKKRGHHKIKASTILTCMKEFLRLSEIHKLTRGVHTSAIYSIKGKRIISYDEIGRHNAVDKILGFALKNRTSLKDKMILTTGRISSEIIYKLINSSAGIIVSRASPTTLSYELSKQYHITMIGRVKKNSFSIFNGVEYIIAK